MVHSLLRHLDPGSTWLTASDLRHSDQRRRAGDGGLGMVHRLLHGNGDRKFGRGAGLRLSYRGWHVLRHQARGAAGACCDMGLGDRVV